MGKYSTIKANRGFRQVVNKRGGQKAEVTE